MTYKISRFGNDILIEYLSISRIKTVKPLNSIYRVQWVKQAILAPNVSVE